MRSSSSAASAGDLEFELGEPEQAGDQRLDHVDGLQPIEAHLALLPEQHAAVQVQDIAGDPVAGGPPRQHRPQHDGPDEHRGKSADGERGGRRVVRPAGDLPAVREPLQHLLLPAVHHLPI